MTKKKNEKGFIIIVALAIFAVLTVLGVIVQITTIDSLNSIKDRKNSLIAEGVGRSMMEYLQFVLKNHEAGS